MQQYVGTKIVNAKPMTRQEYNDFRGWELPANEDGSDEGFLVEYINGGKANTEEFNGYVSWSPKEVFQRAYKCSGSLSFGDALHYLKCGMKLQRAGWNGKGMFVFLVPGSTFRVNRPPLLGIYEEGAEVNYHPHIDMKTATGDVVPWLASQTDVLAEDWCVVDE